jgi:CRP-like cAMP-binding protein
LSGEGEIGGAIYLILDGWAYRYRQRDGRRQILDFLLPGELVGLQAALLGRSEHSVHSLTKLQVRVLDARLVTDAVRNAPELTLRLARHVAAEACRVDELLSAVGSGRAIERMAFLMLSLCRRQTGRGGVDPLDCPFPLRRQHMADALGLTGAHINRMLNHLRDDNIAVTNNGRLSIRDLPRLTDLAGQSAA